MSLVQLANLQAWTGATLQNGGAKRSVAGAAGARQRDGAVLEAVQAMGALTREQVQALFFPFPTGAEKSRQRLVTLWRQGKVKRGRCDTSPSFVYFTERPKQIDHLVIANWVVIRALQLQVYTCYREFITPHIRPDLLLVFKGEVMDPWFVEVQRVVSNFDAKVEKYTTLLHDHDAWVNNWWSQRPGKRKFPRILVVTDGSDYYKQRLVESTRDSGLVFEVVTLTELRRWKP